MRGFLHFAAMEFDSVLRKLLTIFLAQEICEPNHADHVIDHLGHIVGFLLAQLILILVQTKLVRSKIR